MYLSIHHTVVQRCTASRSEFTVVFKARNNVNKEQVISWTRSIQSNGRVSLAPTHTISSLLKRIILTDTPSEELSKQR